MRAFLIASATTVTPGQSVTVSVDVTNTAPAIDGVTARVIGPPGVTTTSEPPLLPLFPDTSGRLVLRVAFPASLPAGLYQAEVQVSSALEPDQPAHLPLEVRVLPKPGVSLTVIPGVGSGRHRARYSVMCDNTGNTALEVVLAATDPEGALRAKFDHVPLVLGPGESAATAMTVRAHRHFLGGEVSHAIKILGLARDPNFHDLETGADGDGFGEFAAAARAMKAPKVPKLPGAKGPKLPGAKGPKGGTAPATPKPPKPPKPPKAPKLPKGVKAPEAGGGVASPGGASAEPTAPLAVVDGIGPGEPGGLDEAAAAGPEFAAIETEAQARFRQPPIMPRGVRTAFVLALIVGLWAGAFLFGLGKAFGSDPLTKEVPASFYAAAKVSPGGNALGLLAGLHEGSPPAGAVPKTGVVEGVGGTVQGTISAASTGLGVGRITVQAVQDSPSGPTLVSSAASGADGTYSLVGLLPGSYKLHLAASGFQDQWYPNATSEASASPVSVSSMQISPGIDATVTGLPGSISGQVAAGGSPPPTVTVSVLPYQGTTASNTTVTTDATGHYVVNNLPTPGTYDLSFTAAGFQAGTDVEVLAGGDQRIANVVTLTAGNGDIDGVVTDGTNPLGGVAITATANGHTVTGATPTTGAVGHFALSGLSTPATYLLTFTKAGYGTTTEAVSLGPGQVNNNVMVVLSGGTGTISGLVKGPTFPGGTPQPLGGVTVTVNGGTSPVTTQTLTAGTIGSYEVSGLTTPGSYTVTLSDGGYASQTLPVVLTSNGSASGVDATLTLTVGVISGTVGCTPAGAGLCPTSGLLSGVTVTASNGTAGTQPTTVTAGIATASPTPSSPKVTYALTGLPAGSYSVTFTLAGWQTQTTFVQLQPGQVVDQQVTMVPA